MDLLAPLGLGWVMAALRLSHLVSRRKEVWFQASRGVWVSVYWCFVMMVYLFVLRTSCLWPVCMDIWCSYPPFKCKKVCNDCVGWLM